jgi:FkbM family methyltransferase
MRAYELFLGLLSRPALYPFWLGLRKLSAHGLNMSAAARMPCDRTGEQIALSHVLAARPPSGEPLVILDVGGNLGHYSALCVRQLRALALPFDLHCFEPSKEAAATIRAELGDHPEVHVHQSGLGRTAGEQVLYAPWGASSGASSHPEVATLMPGGFDGTLMEERFRIDTVDDFVARHGLGPIHLLKIDVEGMELDVLAGARKTIERGQVRFIQFEISGATLLNRHYLRDFWRELADRYTFHLVMYRGLAKVPAYSPHLENFAGAINYLLERRV